MEKDENVIDQEDEILDDEPAEEDSEEVDTEEASEQDDEFEYDEDGNIIIPEVEYEENAEDEEPVEDQEEEPEGVSEETKTTEQKPPETKAPTTPAQPDEVARLKAELAALRSQSKDTLAKLGVKSDDVMEGLASLAAEADGISTKEYLEKKASAERDAQARRLLQMQEFEKIAKADLAELHAAYPETQKYSDIRDLPPEIRREFGKLRDMGLSAKKAYAAANPDGIRTEIATAVKKQSLHESKSHLRTAVPKGAKDSSVPMTRADLATWRDLFPGMTDKEIISLYKNTSK
jgi:hypothetical protein